MNTMKTLLASAVMLLSAFCVSAAPSPWDSWRAGYTNFEQGESLRERGNYTDALRFFEAARKNYQAVRTARPDWNQRVIADRLRDCDRQITELKRLLAEGNKKPEPVAPAEPEKPRKPATPPVPEKKSGGSTPPEKKESKKSPQEKKREKAPEKKPENKSGEVLADSSMVVVRKEEIAGFKKEIATLKLANEKLNKDLQRQRNFESEVAALLRDRRVLEDKYALLEKRYKSLEEELKRPEARIKSLEQRLVEERMNTERLSKQISSLEQQLRIEKENSRMNLAAKNALENLLVKRNEELQRSSSEIAKLNEKLQEIDRLNEKNADLQRQINTLSQEVKRKTEDIAELNKQLLDKSATAAGAQASRKEVVELKQKISALDNQVSKLQGVCGDLEKQLAAARKERDNTILSMRNVEQKNSTLETEKRQLQMSLEQEKNTSKLHSAELAALRERNQSLEADIKNLFDRNVDLEKRLSLRNSADFQAATDARNAVKKLENDLLAVQNELIRLRGELDTAKSSVAEKERKLKSVNDENLKIRADVITAMETEKKLREELNKELNKQKNVQEEYSKLLRNFNALAAENQEFRKMLEAAKPRQAELEHAKIRLAKSDQLRKELAKEQQLNAELRATYQRNLKELHELRKVSAEMDAIRRKLVEFEAVSKEVKRLREVEKELFVLRKREVELTELKVRFSEKESAYRKLESDCKVLIDRVQKNETELVKLRRENEAVGKLNRTVDELQALIVSQNKELNSLKKQLDTLQKNDSEALHISCRVEIDKLRSMVAEIGPLNDRIRALQSVIGQMEKKINESLAKNENLNREIQLKNSEISQLQKLNSELTAIKENSAEELLNDVDTARVDRLEEELAALNKLNAELAAERDLLRARLSGEDTEKNVAEEKEADTDRSPEELVADGFAAEKQGKVELALWNYRQALAANSDSALANYHLGMLYYKRKSYKDAATHLEKAFQAAPENLSLALHTAHCFIKNERFGNAKAIIDPLLLKHPDNAYVQLCGALIEAGCGTPARAEEKMLTAARLDPDSAEIQVELARLLINSFASREQDAIIAYERALSLNHSPVPDLEAKLGGMLNKRKELVRFMSSAAREAESSSDWKAAAWYYDKILEEYNPGFVPLLAFVQWKSGETSRAKETLEFRGNNNKASEDIKLHIRNGQVILALIALAENDLEMATRAAQMSAGAKIPAEWIGVNIELEKLKKMKNPPLAVKILLKSIAGDTEGKK